MTLDEVISYNRLFADMETKSGDLEVAEYYRDTAKCLEELKELREQKAEYKRLLKVAVEDIVWLNEHTVDGEGRCLIETATDMETCLACPLNVNNSHVCGWKHQVEALKLIGDDDNG